MSLRLSDYDFNFPEDLIAASPAEPRDSSRLMVINKKSGTWEHRHFRDLPQYLKADDCLVINTSKVLPCRLSGKKSTGGKAEMLLVLEINPGVWTVLASGFKPGMILQFDEGLTARVESLNAEGEYVCTFSPKEVSPYLEKHGLAPLPPYILNKKTIEEIPPHPTPLPQSGRGQDVSSPALRERSKVRDSEYDMARYQTVYAETQGSIAAPTAGLHFTTELMKKLEAQGVRIARLTLHVGRGTFRPITSQDIEEHKMLPEFYRLDAQAAQTLAQTRNAGGRIVSVGTTATRVLEFLAGQTQGLAPSTGSTDLFIRPGHEFKLINGLITNFHWPKSTPLLLASAFLGREKLLAAYQEAFREKYRLYSYGDAMLVL